MQQRQKKNEGKRRIQALDPIKRQLWENHSTEITGGGLKMTAGVSLITGPSQGSGQALVLAPGLTKKISSEEHFCLRLESLAKKS